MKYFRSVLVCLLFLGACESERAGKVKDAPLISLRIQDDLGQELIFPNVPVRIISLAPNITEMIYFVGGESVLSAVSQACDYPENTREKAIVSTYPELDVESILAHKPDCILTTGEIFPASMTSWFKEYQIPVVFQQYDSLEDIFRNMRQIALLTGRRDQGEKRIDSLRAIADSVSNSMEGSIRYSVAILVNSNPLALASGKGFLNDLIRLAGGKNAAENLNGSYAEVTSEFLLKVNPDFILIPSDSESDALMFLSQYPELASLKAVREKRLIQVDPDIYLRPGPRSVSALVEIHSLLHPGVQK